MRVIVTDSTDKKFIGTELDLPKKGDIITYNHYVFKLLGVVDIKNGFYKLWTSNYIVICKEVE
jgi:hypothetical protein